MTSSPGRTLARIGIALYLIVPAALTLAPSLPSTGARDFARAVDAVALALTAGRFEVSQIELEVLANVLLLVPLGLLLVPALPRVPLSLLLALAAGMSLGVETLQFFLLPERIATLVDVLANTGGAAIGLVLAADVRGGLAARRERRAGLRAGGAVPPGPR